MYKIQIYSLLLSYSEHKHNLAILNNTLLYHRNIFIFHNPFSADAQLLFRKLKIVIGNSIYQCCDRNLL